QQLTVVQSNREVVEAEAQQDIRHRRENLRFDTWRGRSDRVEIALIELAKPPARGPIGAPDRLDLVALEEPRQLVLILRDRTGQRHGEVVAQGEVRFAGVLVLAALQDLENQLVAFFAVLAEQRLDVLERRRLERLEAVALVDVADNVDHVLPPADVVRKKVAGPAARVCTARHLVAYPSSRGPPEKPGLPVTVPSGL